MSAVVPVAAVPGGQPIILDMALSVVARAKIRNAAKRGESIPPTWATDKDGKPTAAHTYWKGFSRRTAVGLVLEHAAAGR